MLSGEALRQQPKLFAQLDSLSPPPRAQFIESPATVSLNGILTNKQLSGDLTIAKPLSDETKNFELPRSNTKSVKLGLIEGKRTCRIGRDEDFLHNNLLARLGKPDAEPDAEGRKNDRDKRAIDLEGVLNHQKLILRPAKERDEDAPNEAENEDVALHLS